MKFCIYKVNRLFVVGVIRRMFDMEMCLIGWNFNMDVGLDKFFVVFGY